MKKVTTLLMTMVLMSSMLWADETITVSAKNSDISEGLDLKVVAKLFAEARNLEEFETMLNNPDSAFCNLDLNDDGQVDYLRVVETGEGSKRLIVLQAVLAKDIYQDVASIYVEKDENNEVSVQVVGDEYVYGTNYIIEPVYVYRPLIYDWFWCDAWYAWHSPWYWGYYPGWWYAHNCWAHDWYWHHCYTYHHHHYCCSFRHPHEVRHGYHDLHRGVSRREYAVAHPDRSFERRNSGYTNARQLRNANSGPVRTHATRDGFARTENRSAIRPENRGAVRSESRGVNSGMNSGAVRGESRSVVHADSRDAVRNDSRNAVRSEAKPVSRTSGEVRTSVTTTRSTSANSGIRSTSINSTSRSTSTNTTSRSTSTNSTTRSTRTNSTARPASTNTVTRSTSTTVRQPQQRPTGNISTSTRATNSVSSSSRVSSTSSSVSSSSSPRSGSYSGGSSGGSRSSGGGFSSGGGGGSRGGGGRAPSSGGGGGSRTRR